MQYRPEIDGLRAVAVVPVILFHAGFNIFGGGFVGVDIFFVISGFLITSIIIGELEQDKFSIVRFYERRARRILPALFFVMLCCIPFAYIWMIPSQFEGFTTSIIAVCLFISNILFWRESDYFAPDSEEKPLLHTWSLAVEEQYYMFFPIFLMMFWRFGRNPVFYSIIVIAALSLFLSEWAWRNSSTANFYLAPTRVWELFAGSVCAFLQSGNKQRKSDLLSGLGLLLVLFSIFFYTEDTPFPSVYALVPVVGSSLIIMYAAQGTWCAQILSMKPFVGIGLISYSAYLWHQPLFAFARIRSVYAPEEGLMLFLALLSIILAYLSWRFVEQPFRQRPVPILATRKAVFSVSSVCISIFILFGMIADNKTYFKNSLSPRAYAFYQFLDYRETEDYKRQFRKPRCFFSGVDDSLSIFDKGYCLNRSDSKKNYIVMGDSHAAHFWYAINEAFSAHNVMQANASGCRPLINYGGKEPCAKLVRYIFEDFIIANDIDGIILSGQWLEDEIDYLQPTITYIKKYVDDVIVVGPTVEYEVELPILLAANAKATNESLEYLLNEHTKDYQRKIHQKMQILLKDSSASYVPLYDYICRKGRCLIFVEGDTPMVFDVGHFTLSGAKKIVGILKDEEALILQ